jgi:Spy/CpxP family protein refolding chaperone
MIFRLQKRDRKSPFTLLSNTGVLTIALTAGIGALTPHTAAAQEARVIIATPSGVTAEQGGPGMITFGAPMAALNSKPSLVNAPILAMVRYFGLTEEQAQKIEEIQKSARPDFKAIFQDAFKISEGDGATTTTPDGRTVRTLSIALDPEKVKEMQAKAQERNAKIQQDMERAEKEIELVLTPEQRPGVNPFLRDLELFQGAMLPAELIRDLDLNGPQKRKLQIIVRDAKAEREQRIQGAVNQVRQSGQASSIGTSISGSISDWRKQVMEKSRAVLTPGQRTIVENWEKEHPQRYGLPGGGNSVIRLGS